MTVKIGKEVSWLSLSMIEQLHERCVQVAGSPVCGMRISLELNQGIRTNMSWQLENLAPCKQSLSS